MRLRLEHAVCSLGIAVAALSLLPAALRAAAAAEGPYLELDTKGHMALIRSLVFTRDGSELISASDDKTIRVGRSTLGASCAPSGARSARATPARSMRSRSPATDACSLPRNLRDGKQVHGLAGVGRPVWSVGFSSDGRSIAWGIEKSEGSPAELGPLGFTLKLPTEDSPTGEPKPLRAGPGKFARAVTSMDGLELKTRASGEFGYLDLLDVVKDRKTLATVKRGEKAGYAHNAYTFSPDGKIVISGGGHGFLTAYDLSGKKLGEFVGHTSDVWAVAVSPDGRFLLSGSDGQTVRLWNMATRENIAALFNGRNGEWVLWTPQGYYAASASGDAHVGWHVNEGERKLARFVSAGQLKRHFYRPDIVSRALILGSASRAVGEAKGTELALSDLLQRKPPEFSIQSPREGAAAGSDTAEIVLQVPPAVDAIEGFDITVNGLRVASRAAGGGVGRRRKEFRRAAVRWRERDRGQGL